MTPVGLLGRNPRILLGGAAIALLVLATFDVGAAGKGLLTAFVAGLSVPAGCLLLRLVHALTGGAWGVAAGPVLARGARSLPMVALLFLPVLLVLPSVYPWAGHPEAARHPDVARLYLNQPAFALRSLAALALLGTVGWRARGEHGPATAAFGLLLYGATISIVATDWVLSLDPTFSSSAFAMSMAVSHLLAGAAWTGLVTDGRRRGSADLLKLAGTFALGLLYLDLMQFLVIYDGNLPDKAAWYVRRSGAGWDALLLVALLLGAVAPVIGLMRKSWRGSATARRLLSGLVLAGLLARSLWWTLPEWGVSPLVWLSTALSLGIIGIAAWQFGDSPLRLSDRREVRHGA